MAESQEDQFVPLLFVDVLCVWVRVVLPTGSFLQVLPKSNVILTLCIPCLLELMGASLICTTTPDIVCSVCGALHDKGFSLPQAMQVAVDHGRQLHTLRGSNCQ